MFLSLTVLLDGELVVVARVLDSHAIRVGFFGPPKTLRVGAVCNSRECTI